MIVSLGLKLIFLAFFICFIFRYKLVQIIKMMEKTVCSVSKPQRKSDDNTSSVESSHMNNNNQENLC